MVEPQLTSAEESLHVSGIVVHAAPDRGAEVAAAIDALSGAEVAGRDAGKLVVVLEAGDEAGLNDLYCRITLLDHVLSAALVSHYRDGPDGPGGE